MDNLRDLLIHELQDVYHAEKQILKALPKMAKSASSPELKEAFATHLSETEEQVRRVEQVFKHLGQTPKAKKCEGMEGLISEGKEIMEEDAEGSVLDAALIAAAQKVEHYEIATYGCLCAWAKLLEEKEALQLLKQNLNEEEATDKKLTEIAESAINIEAEREEEGEPMEEEKTPSRSGRR